jgi:hypothetical protein
MFPGIKFNEVTSAPPSDKAPTLYEYIRDGNLATDVGTQRQEQQQNLRQQHQQEKQMEQQLKEANDQANQAVSLAENAVNDQKKLRQQIERSASSTASQSLINKSKMEQLVIENVRRASNLSLCILVKVLKLLFLCFLSLSIFFKGPLLYKKQLLAMERELQQLQAQLKW